MKALTFLEYCSAKMYPSGTLELESGDDIISFFSQIFKPDMIAEYFDGWEFSHNYEDNVDGLISRYNNKSTDDSIFWGSINCTYYGVDEYRSELPHAETLNDFITDCTRAGIQLTWKPEIIAKYFE